jgi:hypothetical protein
VKIRRGAWNEELLRILEGFPDLAHDDEVNPAAEPWKCSLPRYFRRDHLAGGAKPMPHPYWLQNAIRRNPRSASPGEPIAAPSRIWRSHRSWRGARRAGPNKTTTEKAAHPARSALLGDQPAIEWLEENGFPEPGDGEQAALERYVAEVLAARGHNPAESTIRGYVRRWIDEYRGRVNKGSPRAEPHLTYWSSEADLIWNWPWLAQSADSRLDIWQDSQINDRGDHMSTSLPLAGELADDLLYGADAIGAYPFGREDTQRARRAGYHLVSEPIRKPNTDFPARRGDLPDPHAAALDRRAWG